MQEWIYCDIDGTLTDTPHKPWGKPRQDMIDALGRAADAGAIIVLWSWNGAKYCHEFAEKYAVPGSHFMSKPHLMIDDKPYISKQRARQFPITPEKFMER
jgi:hydroxymethylpyrimidine pyrophosphatase-like HAD family hydrolase